MISVEFSFHWKKLSWLCILFYVKKIYFYYDPSSYIISVRSISLDFLKFRLSNQILLIIIIESIMFLLQVIFSFDHHLDLISYKFWISYIIRYLQESTIHTDMIQRITFDRFDTHSSWYALISLMEDAKNKPILYRLDHVEIAIDFYMKVEKSLFFSSVNYEKNFEFQINKALSLHYHNIFWFFFDEFIHEICYQFFRYKNENELSNDFFMIINIIFKIIKYYHDQYIYYNYKKLWYWSFITEDFFSKIWKFVWQFLQNKTVINICKYDFSFFFQKKFKWVLWGKNFK